MPKDAFYGPLERVSDCCWRIPKSYKPGMRVDGLIYADDKLIDLIRGDQAPEQVANVAFLPGIQHASLAMPDIHWGYGFCIGGVAATDPEEGGVISPGGVGYDINCGVRLVRSNLFFDDVQPRLVRLMDQLYTAIPAGVGQEGKYKFGQHELRQLMREGVGYLKGLRPGDERRHREHRSPRQAGRGRGRQRQPASPGARGEPVRHARLGQPFSGGADRRRGVRRRSRPGDGARKGHGLRDDPQRLARAGLPGLRRRPPRAAQSSRQVRHPLARPAARLRTDR